MTEFARIAVLDIGKTNAKVVVLDAATGQEIAAARMANRVVTNAPYPHYDVEALWAFTLDALASFAIAPGYDAISVTTHGASAALLEADGSLALPVLDYEHAYPQAVRDAYSALRPAFSQTLSPPLSGGLNLGAQLHYQKTSFPDAFSRVTDILTYPQYWVFRLTGVAANEVTSLGCHTDLWQPGRGDYSELVDRLGIRALMAPVRSAFDVLGPVSPDIADRIGLCVPVFCGIHDSNASLLPHLVSRESPFSVVSTGTWVVSFAVGGNLSGLDPARDTLANVDAHGRAVPSSRFMGGREFEMLTAGSPVPPQEKVEAAVRAMIAEGRMLLPSVVSGSGPFPEREQSHVGCKPGSAAETYAITSLYAALMTDACLDLLGAGGPTIVEGPFCENSAYLRTLASFTGRDVLAVSGSTGTSAGAALLTGVHLPSARSQAIEPLADDRIQPYKLRWREHLGISMPVRC